MEEKDENLFDELDNQQKEEYQKENGTEEVKHAKEESDDNTPEEEGDDLFDSPDLDEEEDESPEDDGDDDEYVSEDDDGEYIEVSPELAYLNELGIVDIDEDIDFTQFDEKDYATYISKKYEESIESRINERFSQLPDIVKQLNEYAYAGGDVKQFFSQVVNSTQNADLSSIDINNPNNQEYIVKAALKQQGYDDNFINSQVEFLKTSNNLFTHASAYKQQFDAMKQQQMNAMVERQRQEVYQRQRAISDARNSIIEYVSHTKEVGDIPISYRDKTEIADYITSPAYDLGGGKTLTRLQRDLYYDVLNNDTAVLQLALLLKNRKKDGSFDFSNIQKKLNTEISKKAKDGLRRINRSAASSKESTYPKYTKKSLSEYL